MVTEEMLVAEIAAAQPSIRTRHGKVAFAVHATFVAAGYVLHATSRSLFLGAEVLAYSTAVVLDNWNEFKNDCGFIYSNPERGSKRVVVNCRVMYENLFVGVFTEDYFVAPHHEVYVPEYVDETEHGSRFKNLGKLVAYVNREIISKLESGTSYSQPDVFPLLVDQPTRDEQVLDMMLEIINSMGGSMPDEEPLMYTGDSTGDSMPDEESLMYTGDSTGDSMPDEESLMYTGDSTGDYIPEA